MTLQYKTAFSYEADLVLLSFPLPRCSPMSTLAQATRFGRLAEFTFEHAQDAILWIASDGTVTRVNEAACRMYGYSREEMLDQCVAILAPNYTPEKWQHFWAELATHQGLHMETWHQRKDQSHFPIEATANFIAFEGESHCCVFIRDVSARKQAETVLRTSEAKFRALIEGSVQGIVVHDETFRVLFVNQPGGDIMGFTRFQDAIGTNLLDTIIPPEEHAASFVQFERVMRGEPGPNPIEVRTSQPNGTPGWVLRTHSRIEWEGKPALLATFTDITDRKHAEANLQTALEEVRQLKDRLASENAYLQDEIRLAHNFENIISQSTRFKRVLEQVEQVAATDATVLILGETGTGKELLARAVHNLSPRRERPLVKVNCAALPSNLIESELFGHEKGAFTGALARKIGRFELANGGTIFLDEIGDLPLALQAKLLRVLQEGEFERLGNPRPLHVNVRVIAATNRDLRQAIADGTFREDLYYRLNVFPIQPPPLRARKEDISLLVQHFIQKYGSRAGKNITRIPKRAMRTLQDYHWPGNVRELENIIERAVIISRSDALELGDWFPKSKSATPTIKTLREVERDHILHALAQTNGRVSGPYGAAQLLAINPTTLASRMKKLGIKRQTTYSDIS